MTATAEDEIPPYGTGPYGDAEPAQRRTKPNENAAIRADIIASIERSLRHLLIAIGRDYEDCGKAACARSRRCRGFACEQGLEDER